jgi:hypothetical protein
MVSEFNYRKLTAGLAPSADAAKAADILAGRIWQILLAMS